MKKYTLHCIPFLLFVLLFFSCNSNSFKGFTKESKPWTYWWWMGSSVTRQGITENLEDMQAAGIGGVHIVPIYGEKGDEHNFVRYLSPEWMQLLKHTSDEDKRLGMGVDMTPGTGWPFGGPNVSLDDAAEVFYVAEVKINDHANVQDYQKSKDNTNLVLLAAYDEMGNFMDITSQVDIDGIIHWGIVSKSWRVFAAFKCPLQQKVERAAPGGEGLVIDYFSESSILNYMKMFEDAFIQAGIEKGAVRSFYSDSYEVGRANWTQDFLSEFNKRRGYDLMPYILFLADTGNTKIRNRVVTDYCETISELLYDRFAKNWIKKSHDMGMITRNQAHGSPGNLLDLYALSDIPETETFGASGFSIPGLREDPYFEEARFGRPDPLIMKFASSAGHIASRKLISSESTTWLGDHFKVSLSQIKPQIDEVFVSGINHVFFHGTTYSPKEKPFPGRLFYASTNYGPSSHFWHELPALTSYIARCQNVLQHSDPYNDILLYFPIHEVWWKQKSRSIIRQFSVHSIDWVQNFSFGNLAKSLWDNGYTFDYISDRMIDSLNVEGKMLVSGEARYKAILVPAIEHIPLETLIQLRDIARKGATIIFEKDIPADVPGLFEFEKKIALLANIRSEMLLLLSNVKVTSNLFESLKEEKIFAEEMDTKGLEFIRKQTEGNTVYFISNLSDKFSEDWIQLVTRSNTVEIYDPITEKRGGAAIQKNESGTRIYLQLYPGQSCILNCTSKKSNIKKWEYLHADNKNKFEIEGDWLLKPIEGAPEIPAPVTLHQLRSWTSLGGKYETFSGKAVYTNSFDIPVDLLSAEGFLLDLGIVRETARVVINGQEIGLVWCLPNCLKIPKGIIRKTNTIDIEVTNLSFNRIIQLDKEGVQWKNFYEINFVDIRYKPFDASNQKPEDSGLLSKIHIIPFSKMKP